MFNSGNNSSSSGSVGGSSFGGSNNTSGNILGNSGFQVIQPDPDGPFQVVQPSVVPTKKTSNQAQSSSKTTSGNKTTKTSGKESTNTIGRTITDNFDPKTRAAYDSLLSVLQSGGTSAMKQGITALSALLGRSEDAEEEYTADAARAQAQQSIPLYARALREQILPGIYNAQEGAGLSGDALSSLLAQDQVARLSEQASAAELAAIQAFADISQQQQGITASTASELADDPVQQALQQLIQTGKGAYSDTRTSETVNRIFESIANETYNETTNENIATKSGENTQYQTYGGGAGGGGGGGGGFNSGTSNTSGQEEIALLASLLGPFQNLQHMNARGPLDAFMTGRGQSGDNITQLAGQLGIRL